ncbi:short chain dehydrogenase [Cordyceps fumosorosea ARSEF 2679]|uniref:Short chain dehydrogenase n=1 Tax=Cordyceps fumosorosea (strain ARSEF 2679) TaxID=1081104 RepID=A0A167MYR0_CORFA|nr:short chain dehydrogenase [Cordyceps fumosorosea ARSEF 2679]OAA54917.1 short chain dehydrogenase [Cordyceps fumosorosea ARSEF 2679]
MEVFGLKSQSLRYEMDGFGSVQMYLTTPSDYSGLTPRTAHTHHHHPGRHSLMQAATANRNTMSAVPTQYQRLQQHPKTTLVVGASRGVGKELVRQLAQQHPEARVIASVRSPVDDDDDAGDDDDGHPAGNVRHITLDQSCSKSVSEAALAVGALDTLIVNAAVGDDERLLDTSDERMARYLDVNVTGVLRVVRAFLPALKARKTRQVVLVSSTSGSLARQVGARAGFRGPYAVSKAALNMLAVQLHNELHADHGFTVVPVHPGWVATDMGRRAGDGGMPVAESAAGIVKVVVGLTPQNSATFYSYDGTILPW